MLIISNFEPQICLAFAYIIIKEMFSTTMNQMWSMCKFFDFESTPTLNDLYSSSFSENMRVGNPVWFLHNRLSIWLNAKYHYFIRGIELRLLLRVLIETWIRLRRKTLNSDATPALVCSLPRLWICFSDGLGLKIKIFVV